MRIAALLALLLAPAAEAAIQAEAGPYRVQLTTEPAVVPVGQARMILTISDSAGKPVEGAQVRAIAEMPGMPMGEREAAAPQISGQPGAYSMPVNFPMAGDYVVTVKITAAQGAADGKIPLKTGENTAAAGGGFPVFPLLGIVAILAAGAFILYRMRRTGQHINWRGLFTRQVVAGLLLVAAMLAMAWFAVRQFRRPGAMTPIEAQGMEMSTPAPPGATPVTLATVRRGPVESSVRYTGQAVGFLEQEVTPRVRGYILSMPFYAGDAVRRGQVLARLDTTEIAPQVAERRAMVAMAEQGASVASAEHRQALAAVNQARAAVATRQGAVAEARSQESGARGALREAESDLAAAQAAQSEAQGDLEAAREERAAVGEELAAAQSAIPEAEAELNSARADLQYWTLQLSRTRALLAEGAVSDEEYRREKAQTANSEAKVRQALAKLDRARAGVRAAASQERKAAALITSTAARSRQSESRIAGSRARIEKAQADIGAAAARVRQAQAELDVQRSAVREALSGAEAAEERVGEAQAGVRQARASLGGATTAEGYAVVRSQLDGVVTQRVVSPGQFVNPGQTILRVAQINPIRLQANVAEGDLARIRIGSSVSINEQAGGRAPITARVTSIAPAVDPAARTGIVEVIAPNDDRRFVPGEYVVMEISTGRSSSALYIPASTVRWSTTPSGGVISTQATPYVWLAEPVQGVEDQYSVRRTEIAIGVSNGEITEVLAGLQEGQRVVASGHDYLKNGQTVTAVSTEPDGATAEAASGFSAPRDESAGRLGTPGGAAGAPVPAPGAAPRPAVPGGGPSAAGTGTSGPRVRGGDRRREAVEASPGGADPPRRRDRAAEGAQARPGTGASSPGRPPRDAGTVDRPETPRDEVRPAPGAIDDRPEPPPGGAAKAP